MKEYDVVLYNMYNEEEREIETISARSAESVEKKAISGSLVNHQSGWGVLDSVEHIDDAIGYVVQYENNEISMDDLGEAVMEFLKAPKPAKLYAAQENYSSTLLKSK